MNKTSSGTSFNLSRDIHPLKEKVLLIISSAKISQNT